MSNRYEINTVNSRGAADLIQSIIQKNNWKEVSGTRGSLIWYGLAINDEEIDISISKTVNRIPGMEAIARKRPLAETLKLIHRYYPTHFDISPRTFLLPEEHSLLEEHMKAHKRYFIVKPTAGAQGDGIYLISTPRELENCRMHCWSDVVIQEYIHPPLLLRGKKFDLRVYVVITSVNPLCAFVNEEGLARFCTEDYSAPTNQNINNAFMHLTNYSLNKRSTKFVHTDDIAGINEGSKQTFASLYEELRQAGYPVDLIKQNIKELMAKTLIAIQAGLCTQFESRLKAAKQNKLKCFHILGIDVLLTEDCRAWLLEINANPSLRVDFETEVSTGVYENHPSALDFYVKSMVVEDAIGIARMKLKQQMVTERCGSYERVLPGEYEFTNSGEMFMELKMIFSQYTEIKNPFCIPAGKFRKIYQKIKNAVSKEIIQADFDIIYMRAVKRFEISQMDYFAFISAIEEIARKYFPSALLENVTQIISLVQA